MSGIPNVEPYFMPNKLQFPKNIVDWKIDPDRVILLIHDMQRYFLKYFFSNHPITDLINNITSIRKKCIDLQIPVAYTMQTGDMTPSERGLLKDFWGPGMKADPSDKMIIDELSPSPDDWKFNKWRYSAFHKSNLLEKMHDSKRDQIMICGVYAHIGILMTAVDAFSNDIQTFLIGDGIADFSKEKHDIALNYAAKCCAVVIPSCEVLI